MPMKKVFTTWTQGRDIGVQLATAPGQGYGRPDPAPDGPGALPEGADRQPGVSVIKPYLQHPKLFFRVALYTKDWSLFMTR